MTPGPDVRDAGLYLHIPFCSAVCPYCDFAVHTGDSAARQRFTEDLIREIELYEGHPWSFDTIYFGGGTPSLLTAAQLRSILDAARRHLHVDGDCWLSLEANPEDVSEDSLTTWLDVDVRTLSLGVQSFDAQQLHFLGRRHSAEESRERARLAKSAGFRTTSIDLIFGLPRQSEASWRRDLASAIELAPEHVSCYQLTIHEGTPFHTGVAKGVFDELDDDSQAELYFRAHRELEGAGLHAYEVSNFAADPEHRSRHNEKYWTHTPYLGLGPSAHSFDGTRRWWNERGTREYQARIGRGERPVADSETLSTEQLALEAVMLGLRRDVGVDLAEFETRFGIDLVARNEKSIADGITAGHFTLSDGHLTLTFAGLAIADGIVKTLEVS